MACLFGQTVSKGFPHDSTTDCTIKCRNKTFGAHEVVLREHEYFANILQGNWLESERRVLDFSVDGCANVEGMLMHIYGTDLDTIVKKFALPVIGLGNGYFIDDATAAIPSKSAFGPWRTSEPPSAVAQYHCHNLRTLCSLHVIADKYCVQGLKEDTSKAFAALLCDSWNSSEMLDVIELLWSPQASAAKILRESLAEGIVARADLLTKDARFNNLVVCCGSLGADLFFITSRQLHHSNACNRERFCVNYTCRRNGETRAWRRAGERECPTCGKQRGLRPMKETLWEDHVGESSEEEEVEDYYDP